MIFKDLTTTKDFGKFYYETLVPYGVLYDTNEIIKSGHIHKTEYITYNANKYLVVFTDGKIETIKKVVW